MSEARSLLVKYEWNPAWQEKWGLSPGDTERCACVLCMLWSYSLQRPASHSAMIGRRTVFHKWAPVLAGEWQATGSVRIWEHRGPGPGRASTASAKARGCSCKDTWFSLPHTRCQQSARPIRACGARLASKTGGVFHHDFSDQEGQERLIQTGWPLSFHSFSSLFVASSLSFLFFSPVSPTDFLLICNLSPSPLSLPAPLSLSQPAHLYSFLT